MKPSTTERATSSKFPIRARTTGSTKRAPGIVDADMEIMVSPLASGLGLQASGLNPAHGRGWLRRRAGESGLKAEAGSITFQTLAPARPRAAGPRGRRS